MSSVPEQPRRLFLALWPEAAERERMVVLAQTVTGGRKVQPDNLHLTLVFLGVTPGERLRCYEQALQDIPVPRLTLTLDRMGYWPRSGILWLGASRTPPPLLALVTDLNRRLETCGFTPERRPFQVHITLARKFPGSVPVTVLDEPLAWYTEYIVLVESLFQDTGVRYQVLRRWPQ